MYGTVQQTAYYVPTLRRSSHHSQIPFDSSTSLTVKPVSHHGNGNPDSWKNNYGRSCWTADLSRYDRNRHPSNQTQQPIVVHPLPGYRRSNTTMDPASSNTEQLTAMPATASLPRRGQVKLTSLDPGQMVPTQSRAKTVGCRGQRRSRHNELGNIPTFQHHAMEDIYKESSLSDLTVADLKSVIDTEFPETQGLAFNRASHFIRTATANLIKAHSRPASQASLAQSVLQKPESRPTTSTKTAINTKQKDDTSATISEATTQQEDREQGSSEGLVKDNKRSESRPNTSRKEKDLVRVQSAVTDIVVNIPTS